MKFLILIAVLGITAGVLSADANAKDLNADHNQRHPVRGNPSPNVHSRVKRNWPFRSSQRNADIVNSYYQGKPEDTWWIKNVEKPFARYIGRAFGDEFPRVRDSLIEHQNEGKSFWEAHQFDTGYHPRNWVAYNWDNDNEEDTEPYNGVNQFGESPFLNYFSFYHNLIRNGERETD